MEMDLGRLRSQSVDDEDWFGCRNCNSSFNSDSEYSGSVSVRDMIRHYDNQMQTNTRSVSNNTIRFKGLPRRPHHSHHSLLDEVGGGCVGGVGGLASQILENRKKGNVQWELNDIKKTNGGEGEGCCKYCTPCRCCQNRSRKNFMAVKSVESNTDIVANPNAKNNVMLGNVKNNNNDVMGPKTVGSGSWLGFKEDKGGMANNTNVNAGNIAEKKRLLSPDSTAEANFQPTDTSYQSKTTIAKTASGVRIIIDIFYDQEQHCVNATDVVGSRVETDIPHSRILSEFQQQAKSLSETSLK